MIKILGGRGGTRALGNVKKKKVRGTRKILPHVYDVIVKFGLILT